MKNAFITGGNRGLGKGFAEYLLSEGYRVFIGVRHPETVPEDLINNRNLNINKLDVLDDESILEAFKQVSLKTGNLNLLVNNAGFNKDSATNNHKELVSKLDVLDRSSLVKMFNANSISPILVVKAFLPLLNTDPAFVINISSARSSYKDENENTIGNYGYRASKAALNMMTFASTWDLPKNVRTFSVHPGSVKTVMNPTGSDDPIKQAMRIIEITNNWKDEFNGKFLRYDGTLYPL